MTSDSVPVAGVVASDALCSNMPSTPHLSSVFAAVSIELATGIVESDVTSDLSVPVAGVVASEAC